MMNIYYKPPFFTSIKKNREGEGKEMMNQKQITADIQLT